MKIPVAEQDIICKIHEKPHEGHAIFYTVCTAVLLVSWIIIFTILISPSTTYSAGVWAKYIAIPLSVLVIIFLVINSIIRIVRYYRLVLQNNPAVIITEDELIFYNELRFKYCRFKWRDIHDFDSIPAGKMRPGLLVYPILKTQKGKSLYWYICFHNPFIADGFLEIESSALLKQLKDMVWKEMLKF